MKGEQSIGDKLKEQGNQQLKMENYVKAIEFYTRAIGHDSSNFAYFHNRSLAHYLLENMCESLVDARKARELNGSYVPAFIREASALAETDEPTASLEVIESGLKLDSTNSELLELRSKVSATLSHEATVRGQVLPASATMEANLFAYVQRAGGVSNSIKLAHAQDGNRSVIARRVIHPKEVIMSLPLEHAITLEHAKSNPFFDSSAKFTSEKHVAFALCLLHEGLANKEIDGSAKYAAFLESLPKDFSHFPAFYTEEEMKLLEGSSAIKKINEQLTDMQRDYQTAKETSKAFNSANIDFKTFQEAMLLSHSRVFKIDAAGVSTSAMVPLADMCNHAVSGTEEAEWGLNAAADTFEIRAVKRIARNAEIRFTYGSKCNSTFLMNYGFIEDATNGTGTGEALTESYKQQQIEEINAMKSGLVVNPKKEVIKQEYFGVNKFNELPVLFGFDENDVTLPLKAKLMRVDALPKACLMRVIEDFEHANSSGWLGFLRFIAIRDPNQLGKLYEAHRKFTEQTNQNNLPFLPQKTPPMSVENESAMWSKVQELLIPQLLAFKTSVVKDVELLKENGISQNVKNALLVRIGEKRILEFYITMANKMMGFLNGMEKKDILDAARLDLTNAPYFHYIIQVILARLLYQK